MTPSYSTSVDHSDMRSDLIAWPDMVHRGWVAGREAAAPFADQPAPRSVLWAGMGGSAIGGDYLAALAARRASFPVLVHRGGPLPAWVGPDDVVLLVSYSGTTAETLDTAAAALERGCRLMALTSGGRLAEIAAERGFERWSVTGGKMPRAMLAEMFATALGAFHEHGWLTLSDAGIERDVTMLRMLTDMLNAPPTTSAHPLHAMLESLTDRHPMIYGSGLFMPVARRWACQINENAKRAAQWGVLPEMNHNEVVAWIEGGPWGSRYQVILLSDPDAPADVLQRIPATRSLAEGAGWPVRVQTPVADTHLGRILEQSVVGDWLSYWMALAAGMDPTPIPPIDALKASLQG